MGADKISSFILKDCASVFVFPLYSIFNLIFRQTTFPDLSKRAYTYPVFKKDASNDIELQPYFHFL